MELDPERMRLKRIEEQLQAERRKFEEERRRFDEERRAGPAIAPSAGAAPVPPPPQLAPHPQLPLVPSVPLATPASSHMGNKTAMFLGGAGAVLLLGIGLLLAKSLWFPKADDGNAVTQSAADATAAVVVAAPPIAMPDPVAPQPAAMVAPPQGATPPVESAVVAVLTPEAQPPGPNDLAPQVTPAHDEAAIVAAKKAEQAARKAEALAKKRAAERAAAKKQAELDKEDARRLVVQAQGSTSKSAKVDYLRRAISKDPANVLYPQLLRQAEAELQAEQQALARKQAAEAAARKQSERPPPSTGNSTTEAARLAELGKRATSKAVKVMYLKQAVAKDPLNAVYKLWLKQAEQELAAESAARPVPQQGSPAPQPVPGRVATSELQAAANYAAAAQRTSSKTLKVFYWRLATQKDPGNAYYKTQLKQAEVELAAERPGRAP